MDSENQVNNYGVWTDEYGTIISRSDLLSNDQCKAMYEYAPYPDLGTNLKNIQGYLNSINSELAKKKNIKFLDAGCGTGHVAVGVAKNNPNWSVYAVDLSNASLGVAKKLAEKHCCKNINFAQVSYEEKLPFPVEKFDVICAVGTIHHSCSPLRALENLRSYLALDGYFIMHMYGRRVDQGKFDIKEMLNILEPNLNAFEKRFEFYQSLIKHKKMPLMKRMLECSPMDFIRWIRTSLFNLKRKINKQSWSPSWTLQYEKLDSPWIDHFCHPSERAYEVTGIQDLIEKSGFTVVHMFGQGSYNEKHMPKEWKEKYNSLNVWQQYRINELLSPAERSFSMVLKKADSNSYIH